MLGADESIDRNRGLLARAAAARAYKRLVVEEMAENRLRLHLTLVRTVHLHYGRSAFLSEMIYSASVDRRTHDHSPRQAALSRPQRSRWVWILAFYNFRAVAEWSSWPRRVHLSDDFWRGRFPDQTPPHPGKG